LEIQTTYTPVAGDFGDGRHALVFGLHRNQYRSSNVVYKAADWLGAETALNQRYLGKTLVHALYGQDAWKITPDWQLTSGLRLERFTSSDGSQFFAGPPQAQQTYPSRTLTAASPKLSLAWAARDDLRLRASYGRGVRFPNVDELFNGTQTGSSITVNDPMLRPEKADSFELTAEKDFGAHWIRASLFRDDVRDTILRQTDSTVTPSVTRVSNVDRVLTDGLELVWHFHNIGLKGLDLGGSATWARAIVKENRANPAQVGKAWFRIPLQRYVLQASYRPSPTWLFAVDWRWTGRQYNTALNVDVNPNTYGGTSYSDQVDLKAAWQFSKGWEWSLAAMNVAKRPSWQAHSMPQRSIQTELRYALR
jgi:iron complex outermembrane receptor protein